MEEMTFNVKFFATGIPEGLVSAYGNILIAAHNRMAEITNGKYETWNKEFDYIYGIKTISDEFDPRYIDFINGKIKSAAFDVLHKEFSMMSFSMNDESQLVGHVKAFPNSSIYFGLMPVK